VGDYFKSRLLEFKEKYPFIQEVRGLGLILGMKLDVPGGPVVEACREKGFLINCTQETVLRFIPPLIIRRDEIDRLLEELDRIFGEMS
jgi:acetylornithine/N-succinyldiaminopimelate aminotransferase